MILGVGAITLPPSSLISAQQQKNPQQNLEHLLIQDKENFDANPRIFFNNKNEAIVNILPKPDKNLEVELYVNEPDAYISSSRRVARKINVNDSLDIPFYFWPASYIKYQLRWRNYDIKNSKWRAGPEYLVKTPYTDLDRGDKIVLILWADDHAPADDADIGKKILLDEQLRQDRINGDCYDFFIQKFIENPDYKPEPDSEEAKILNCWTSSRAQYEIALRENPHAIINLGDSNAFGFFHKWQDLGLRDRKETTPKEIDSFGEIFFRNLRKKISPTSPFVATYFVNGNHDGKLGNNKTMRNKAIRKTIKFLRQPAWGQDSHEQNYFPLFFGLRNVVLPISGDTLEEDVLVMILDGESYLNHKPEKPEDYTLGDKQMYDLKNLLGQARGVKYKFYLIHRLVGGMFGGPFGNLENHSYARGLLATKDDYEELKKLGIKLGLTLNPNQVEQVHLTNLFMEHNLSGRDRIIIGHDHVYTLRHVEDENGQLDLMCAGALKHKGEINFYDGPYSTLWNHFYGDFGVYHQDNRASKSGETDFWSPSGYVRLTISRDVITSEYIRAADNYPLTNIPIDYEVGDVLPNIMHTEFPSKSDYGFIY